MYDDLVDNALVKWSNEQQLARFGRKCGLQVSSTTGSVFIFPGGYATTNNPVELFKRLIIRVYPLRTNHTIGTLIDLLADRCDHPSVTPKPFNVVPEVTQQLNARVKDFRQGDLLVDKTQRQSSIDFLLVSPTQTSFTCYHVDALLCFYLS
ncbi:unnamed protein product [Phytophthora fragariaefolia]|uniref:Unnamed protein product n=1 Tax=Phytophthora fragariaefolia TaxID=1490495 RepID=A0A9W7CZ76_9STRA|nr:unnamed protein product [Phytophthora fragariaefolia]